MLRSASPGSIYRRLLAQGLGRAEVTAAPEPLIEALRLSARRIPNATVHEMAAGHGPWLVDPRHVAGLIAAHHESVRSHDANGVSVRAG